MGHSAVASPERPRYKGPGKKTVKERKAQGKGVFKLHRTVRRKAARAGSRWQGRTAKPARIPPRPTGGRRFCTATAAKEAS